MAPTGPPPNAEAAPPAEGGGRSRLPLIVAIVVVLALIGGGAAFVLTSGDDDDAEQATTTDEQTSDDPGAGSDDPGSDDPGSDDPGSDGPTSDEPDGPPGLPVAEDASWSGTIIGRSVRLREDPGPDGTEIETFDRSVGMAVEVITDDTGVPGWYEVRLVEEDLTGYMFGALLDPPAPGYCVGIGTDSETFDAVPVEDLDGEPYEGATTGELVLIVGEDEIDGRFPVLLPEGDQGWVQADEIAELRCG